MELDGELAFLWNGDMFDEELGVYMRIEFLSPFYPVF